ncbi:MAG: hypothetical protein IJN69_03065 [Oscillospiraceae bacterium]|nr:hypothetical protein [Oscillospiraceae bacterium]
MKSFINTAKIEYLDDERIRTVCSNRLVIPVINRECFVSGEVLCRPDCRRWTVAILEKKTESPVFRLKGYVSKGFYYQINPGKQYIIRFDGDSNSTLRLYNIPDCVTVNFSSL